MPMRSRLAYRHSIGILGLSFVGGKMTEDEIQSKHQRIRAGVKAAIAQAIERHRQLGESIAVWQDGKVVVLSADQIPTAPASFEQASSD